MVPEEKKPTLNEVLRSFDERLDRLEARSHQSRNERQTILLLLGGVAALLLAVKIHVGADGQRSFSFDGSLINLEMVGELASLAFVGGAGYKMFCDRTAHGGGDGKK